LPVFGIIIHMPEQEPKQRFTRNVVRIAGAGVAALGSLRLNLVEVLVGLGIIWAGGKIGARQTGLERVRS
jgi:hypothetical protein